MTENASANIAQLLTSFDTFVKTIEDPEWIKTANVEDIKTAFKLGTFIEKTTNNFKSTNNFESFLKVLTKWWKIKHRNKTYSENFYIEACDELLIKFFRYPNISQCTLDIAVRVYTSLFLKKRFEEVLTKLFIDAGNLEAITDYLKANISKNDAENLKYQLQLQCWNNLLQVGEESSVQEEIKDMLTPFNLDEFLYILIGILSLKDVSDIDKIVQNIIINIIIEKMLDRSILTNQFWITLLKNINKESLLLACENFKIFLDSFLNFIVYTGSMMNKIDHFWKADPSICFYPEIGYDDIVCHIDNLCNSNTLKHSVISRLNGATGTTTNEIWKQVLSNTDHL